MRVLMTLEEVKKQYNNGTKLEFVLFWGGYLSNWFNSKFIIANTEYNCVEQYMMAEKAKLFNDTEHYRKIMESDDPKRIKEFGRKVKNYDDTEWIKHRVEIVYQGNLSKFKQNEKLRAYLLNTGDKVLVEASPFDKIWGVGLNSQDKLIQNPNNWAGTNYLGFVLMSVRDELKRGE